MERITVNVLMYRPKITAPQLTGLVLGHIFLELDEPHSGEFLVLHSKELKDSLVVLLVGVDGDEEQLALVFLQKKIRCYDLFLRDKHPKATFTT
jgi:hypothetical protein